MQLHDGKGLYRDLWCDKPPLTALFLNLFGRPQGWKLSLVEAFVAWSSCVCAYFAARELGERKAGLIAAALLGFFLTFYIPTAVIPIAPDFLMLTPHLAAIAFAFARKPWLAGFCAAVAFWINTKGVFVLVACLVIAPAEALPLLLGFAIPGIAAGIALFATGAWSGYVDQVWRWSFSYARNSPVANPWWNGVTRTLNWAGFHAALLLGSILYFRKRDNSRSIATALWIAISFVAVAQGLRFLPRYYFQLLAPLTIVAAIGYSRAPRRVWILAAAAITLAIPLIRFGPEYAVLALDNFKGRAHHWSDLALDQDDQAIAAMVNARAKKNDTLFVWGYRPGIYIYTHLDSPSIFWDSQPLTGVPADRHLTNVTPIDAAWAQKNRVQFGSARPTFLIDSLSAFNPALSMNRYPELHPLVAHYGLCAKTQLSTIYCLQ